MVYVTGALALLLAVAAYRSEERWLRVWFAAWCLLNVVAGVLAVANGFPYAYRLMPNG